MVLAASYLSGCGGGGGLQGGDDAGVPADAAPGGDLPAGGCSPKCMAPTPVCTASHKCVACAVDNDCPIGRVCKMLPGGQAVCTPGCKDDSRCGPGKACCGSQCVDVETDSSNCGMCGVTCAGLHSLGQCAKGQCQAGACMAGFGDCNKDPKDGCEANLHTDVNNCTACGMKCAIKDAINACADGCYEAACRFGFDDCNGDPMDGCETTVLADAANCGGCGMSCSKLPHASANCVNAGCVLGACDPGYFDCNGDPKDGCEAFLKGDSKNCGQCGSTCPQNLPNCVAGACSTLPPSFANWGGIQWFKIQVNGAMSDTNVANACKNAGLTVPCQAAGVCTYDDMVCSMKTPEKSCGNPMQGLAQAICNGQNPPQCMALNGVYQYMGHKWNGDSACGAFNQQWCSDGKGVMNQFALCIQF